MAKKLDLTIEKGKTFKLEMRWEVEPIVYKDITEITCAAPVRVKAVGHGLPDGWNAAITNVKGPTELNAEANNVQESDYHACTKVDVDTITINSINAAGFKPYVSGGVLQYNTPGDLSGCTVRMSVRAKLGAVEELLRLDTSNSRITLDNVKKVISLEISATISAALTFKKGVYDAEIQDPSGVVTKLLYGDVTVAGEVTTT